MKPFRFLRLLAVAFVASSLPAAEPTASPADNVAVATPPPTPTRAEITALDLGPTIAAGTAVTTIETGFGFTEGVTTAPNGDVYFVDQNNNRILKWSVADNKGSIFLEPSGRANGQYFDGKGNLISCCDEKNELWSITPDGKHTVILTSAGFEGKPLDGPNDVWVRPDGGMYLTDPYYPRAWWDQSVPRPAQSVRSVYYLSPDHQTITRAAGDPPETMRMPNGIIGTPDGKTLYVADIDGQKTYGFDIQPDGSLTHRRLICNLGSDGMTLDNQGHLYLSPNIRVNGVVIVEVATGKMVGFIPLPQQPGNMGFGGKNHDTLYVGARTGFYSIVTKVKGANPAK